MTIQLLQTWAGKPAGIYTLDPGEESRLIGLGLARAYVLAMDGTAGDGAGEAVIAATTLPIAAAAGAPVMAGMLLRDPATGLIYGQSDGAGGYDPLGAAAGTVGTGTVSAPALVVSTGFSNAVAAAMEALSAALPKDGQWTDPRVAEQGVIELGNGAWTLEKTFTLDLSGASTSRYGLTIRGQGRASTILKTATTAPVANFRGGDGIWRLMQITNASGANNSHLRLEGFSLVSYATQGADGSTPLSDPARWLDLKYCLLPVLRDLRVYHRYPTALSLDQASVALESCYYARLDSIYATNFNTTTTKANASGTLKARKGGVGFRFKNNNALVGAGLWALGGNLGFHLINENGLTLHGGAIEEANKGFLFDGTSSSNRVFGYRHEYNLTNLAMEAAGEMYFARFGEATSNNYVEQFASSAIPGGACQDYSASKSNRVFVPREIRRRSATNLLSGASWTDGAGVSSAAGADWPSHLDPSITSSVQVTMDGTFNRSRKSAAVTVNPDWGSVLYRVFCKRVSGAGFLTPDMQSVAAGGSAPVFGSRPQDPVRAWATLNASVPVASGSWSGGKLTMVCAREHGVQDGMRVRNAAAWGSLAINTDMYVESTPNANTVVLIASAAGTIADPGAITFPTTMTLLSDMVYWSFCPDITADWREFATNVPIRIYIATAPSLDGSNKAIIPIGSNTLGLQTGSKIKLSGFADSRLNGLAYTVQAGDVSGSNLTLSAASAMAGLVTTATSKGQSTTSYGYLGLTEVVAEWRGVTTNTGQSIVWEVAGETIMPGYSDEM